MAYNHLKDKVKGFLKPFAESGQAVGAEDVKRYFEKLRGDEAAVREAGGKPGTGGVDGGAEDGGDGGAGDGDRGNGAEGQGRREQRGGFLFFMVSCVAEFTDSVSSRLLKGFELGPVSM